MNLIEIFLIILCIQVSNIFMFVFFMFANEKKIKLNPVQLYKEHKENEEEEKKQRLIEQQILESLENIDNYNGTSTGQKDITRDI